ncbi:hypothetical protein A2U01_0095579, partial [Trifolium medium]|nr:hypothetical protein [Trifolium medium]
PKAQQLRNSPYWTVEQGPNGNSPRRPPLVNGHSISTYCNGRPPE